MYYLMQTPSGALCALAPLLSQSRIQRCIAMGELWLAQSPLSTFTLGNTVRVIPNLPLSISVIYLSFAPLAEWKAASMP